ncbi:MAG TPA: hypothetical protein PKO06_20905, partial [Candidatus Ozemobacteraceae bacterium]|nr:hypothetical protein [Candidatus Ozemobacteraceae bacterium]
MMRRSLAVQLFFLALFFALHGVTSVGAGSTTRDVWKKLTDCLQAGKSEREQEAARLGVTLPSQMPSAYDVAPAKPQPSVEPAVEPAVEPTPRFQEWTKHEADAEVQRQAGASSDSSSSPQERTPTTREIILGYTESETPSPESAPPAAPAASPESAVSPEPTPVPAVIQQGPQTFPAGEPKASDRMEVKPQPVAVSPEHEKAVATAKALGVPENRELGEFLAYFPAVEDEPVQSQSAVSATEKAIQVPQVTLGTVVEVTESVPTA